MLNYVDFRKVLHGFGKHLKPDGRIIVFNLPNRGNGLLFSDKGLKDNRQLYALLEEHHFEIGIKRFLKGLGMRQTNQRNSSCWWQESVLKHNRKMLNHFWAIL
jgi:hypothetical protein